MAEFFDADGKPKLPKDINFNEELKNISLKTTLSPDDELTFQRMIREVRDGKAAVFIVSDENQDKLKYFFIHCKRVEAMRMMVRVEQASLDKFKDDE